MDFWGGEHLVPEAAFSATRWVLGFSGGLDSTVLLHILAHVKVRPPLWVVHINHQLNPLAEAWEAHARRACADYEAVYESVSVNVVTSGLGIESAAREARYQAFSAFLIPGAALFTAHHQNDQAETFLLQALRGAGSAGLAAMPAAKPISQGVHYRPLLDQPRSTLLAYAQKQGLTWVEDDSNTNTAFDRNFLRQHILSPLSARKPSAIAALAQSAQHQQEVLLLLDELARLDWKVVQADQPYCLSVSALRGYSLVRQRHILRYALRDFGFPVCSRRVCDSLVQMLFVSAEASPQVSWSYRGQTICVRRYRDWLWFSDSERVFSASVWHALCTREWVAQILGVSGSDWQLRFRKPGFPNKRFFQAHHIPPWWRDQLPLIERQGQLVAGLDYAPVLAVLFKGCG